MPSPPWWRQPTAPRPDLNRAELIRSVRNRRITQAVRLHQARERRRSGLMLLEGPNVVGEALAAGIEIVETFVLHDEPDRQRWPGAIPVEAPVMDRLAPSETPRGPVAIARIPAWRELDTDRTNLILWEVSDPGNVGAIVRSAAAFGLGVAISAGCADPWSPKALRAGAGAHFRVPTLARFTDPGELMWDRTVATVARGGSAPEDLAGKAWDVVIGSEAHGLPADVVDRCAHRLTIPMPGAIESLNAAVAAGIVAYVLSRAGQDHH